MDESSSKRFYLYLVKNFPLVFISAQCYTLQIVPEIYRFMNNLINLTESVACNTCSMGISLQNIIEEDDHPPSSRRTPGCAVNNVIISAGIRMA
jgi:hypothetical protein